MYKEVVSPLLDKLDSERMHVYAREALHYAEMSPVTLWLLEKIAADHHKRFSDERLHVVLGGIEYENPLIVAAGWDKAGRALRGLHRLGAAATEVGTVPEFPQPGNEKPRQFILASGVALNRLGFNSDGAIAVKRNIQRYANDDLIIGISLGQNKEVPPEESAAAHARVADLLYEEGTYFTINVSSPNTPGLRGLLEKSKLTDIVQAVQTTMDNHGARKPLYVKISPDMDFSAIDDVIEVVRDYDLTGIIATNTTTNEEIKAKYGEQWRKAPGGLSGDDEDFRNLALRIVGHIYTETQGAVEVHGAGGVKDAETAWQRMAAGASGIHLLTAIRGEGPGVFGQINRGLVARMERDGITKISDIVGSQATLYKTK